MFRPGTAHAAVVANPVDGLSIGVLTRIIEYAGKSLLSADSNVQVQAGLVEQQVLETISVWVCMGCCGVVAQFPQQSCPVLADTPPRVAKKQTSNTTEPSLYDLRYRFMIFSLNAHEKIELILQSVKLKVFMFVTI